MKPRSPALQRMIAYLPLTEPVALGDLEAVVSVLAERFGLDPARAAKEIRGSSTLARLLQAACSVPVRAPRPRGRPPKASVARELDLIRHLERRGPGKSKAAAIEEYASAKGETVEAVKKRESRTDQLWK